MSEMTTLEKIERAEKVVAELCKGERRWVLSIPARPNHDPDWIIGGGLLAARDEIVRLTRELEEARAVLEDVRDALEVLPPGILGEASEVVEASDGEVGVRSWMIRDELIDRINRALRSEWRIDEPAREIVRREMPDTRATVREVADAALRSEAQGEAELDEPAREAVEARWWASEGIRAARRGEGGGE